VSRKYEIYSAIKSALVSNLSDVKIVDGHPTAGNKQLTKTKVIGLSIGNEVWTDTQRPNCELTIWIDCFYRNAYKNLDDFLTFEEQVLSVLLSKWDYDLSYIKGTYIISINTDEGLLTPHGSFHIELRVEYYRDVRNF